MLSDEDQSASDLDALMVQGMRLAHDLLGHGQFDQVAVGVGEGGDTISLLVEADEETTADDVRAAVEQFLDQHRVRQSITITPGQMLLGEDMRGDPIEVVTCAGQVGGCHRRSTLFLVERGEDGGVRGLVPFQGETDGEASYGLAASA